VAVLMGASLRRAGPRRQLLAAVCALACATLLAPLAPAMAGQSGELARSVKAAFLVKFLDYADFPAHAFSDAGAALVIGVLGADEMAHEVRQIVGARAVNGRPVTVRPVREGDTAPVHLLFVAGSDSTRVTRVLRQWAPAPILLVSECVHGLEAGSTINFKIIEQHVRFDVSLDAAEKSNIKLSSRLLSVANHVSKGVP
jgi:hypothetical protein